MPKYLRQVEAAALIGVSRQVIGNWIARGKLRGVFPPGVAVTKHRPYVLEADVLKLKPGKPAAPRTK